MVELCSYCGDPYPHKGTCKDLYSRYSAKAVLPAMDRMSMLGIPEYVASDNGHSYNSNEFQQFARYMDLNMAERFLLPRG